MAYGQSDQRVLELPADGSQSRVGKCRTIMSVPQGVIQEVASHGEGGAMPGPICSSRGTTEHRSLKSFTCYHREGGADVIEAIQTAGLLPWTVQSTSAEGQNLNCAKTLTARRYSGCAPSRQPSPLHLVTSSREEVETM